VKMKMSIIIGVTQMMLGIILSLFNGLHFNKKYNIYFEFIPQVIFMMSTFGYMVILIFYKWCIDWRGDGAPSSLGGQGAPSILNLMISMFLSPRLTPIPMYHLYGPQGYIQLVLIFFAIVSVPVMLVVKPLLMRRDHNRQQLEKAYNEVAEGDGHGHAQQEAGHGAAEPAAAGGEHGEHGEEFDFSEIVTHQAIHTIEFVLGCISNTASYLRLWALSLAHAELSKVFLEMVMIASLSYTSLRGGQFILIFIGFAVWAALTVAVLLMMESLSAFLHALRLHWVEFQNKFYSGDGYKFAPFSYATILDQSNAK